MWHEVQNWIKTFQRLRAYMLTMVIEFKWYTHVPYTKMSSTYRIYTARDSDVIQQTMESRFQPSFNSLWRSVEESSTYHQPMTLAISLEKSCSSPFPMSLSISLEKLFSSHFLRNLSISLKKVFSSPFPMSLSISLEKLCSFPFPMSLSISLEKLFSYLS